MKVHCLRLPISVFLGATSDKNRRLWWFSLLAKISKHPVDKTGSDANIPPPLTEA
jgi:hypothetical protein